MQTIDIHEAETGLSRLVEKASKGESFIIAKADKPLVKVAPLDPADVEGSGRLGFMRGEIEVADDFDRMGDVEIAALFAGGEP